MKQIENDLRSLRLSGMAQRWATMVETRDVEKLSLADGMRFLIQEEVDQRRDKRNTRLIKRARFRYGTTIEQLTPDATRGLDKTRLMELSQCDFIRKGQSVLITGAAGTGKSSLATAIGYQACLLGYKVIYFNVMKLFEEIRSARLLEQLPKFFHKLLATDLLILDDFGLKVLDGQQLLDFMEILEDRHGLKSTIIIGQVPVSSWYDILSNNKTAADAILDRLVHTSIRFELKGSSRRAIK